VQHRCQSESITPTAGGRNAAAVAELNVTAKFPRDMLTTPKASLTWGYESRYTPHFTIRNLFDDATFLENLEGDHGRSVNAIARSGKTFKIFAFLRSTQIFSVPMVLWFLIS